MAAKLNRLGLPVLALVLALTGCNVVRARMDTMDSAGAAGSRGKNTAKGAPARLEALQQENEALRKEQQATQQKLDALHRDLAAEKEEQRRFREMMATNFDLLEQSVSLSLSKSVGQKGVVEPRELKLPESTATREPAAQGAASNSANSAGARNTASETARTGAGIRSRPASAATMPPAPAATPAAAPSFGLPGEASGKNPVSGMMPVPPVKAGDAVRPVAMRDGAAGTSPNDTATNTAMPAALVRNGALDDPDLNPPAEPRTLRGHRKAKRLYDRGFGHFARSQYDQAIMVYQDFLNRFPADVYSDNAQFWIGESYYRQNRFAEAETAYREVLRNYEHRSTLEGYKTPDAIYRIGQTYLNRGDERRARYYFAAAAQRFPATSAGRKALRERDALSVETAESPQPAGMTRGS